MASMRLTGDLCRDYTPYNSQFLRQYFWTLITHYFFRTWEQAITLAYSKHLNTEHLLES